MTRAATGFTGKERDAESGLDYFGARYFSSAQGRFTSPDPFTVTPARVLDPQQLNLYAYGRNNPLKYFDPTGMIIDTNDLSDKDKKKWSQIVALANKTDSNGNYVNKNLHDAYTALDQDQRTFVVENSKLSSGTAGLFTITEFSGANDFSKATLQLDFSKIQSVDRTTPADLVPGFNKYEGILGDNIKKLAETFGHEANHGVFAIQNTGDAVGLERLLNDRDSSMKASGYPFPPEVMKKIDDANKGLGAVPPGERDPKRSMTPKEKGEKLAEQGGNCAHCDKPIEGENGIAHHDPVRQADGGTEMKVVHKDCHTELHCGGKQGKYE